MIKKLFSSLFILILLFSIIWLVTGWYFGKQAEQAFLSVIQENSQLAGEKIIRAELLSYRRTLLGADASLRLSSDIPLVNEYMDEVDVKVKIYNGPIFLSKSDVSLGSSRWLITIDESSLAPEAHENINHIFPESLPTAIVRLGFDQKSYYLLRAKTNLAELLLTGIFDLKNFNNRGAITLDHFSLDMKEASIAAEKVNISYQHQKAISAAYKPGTSSVNIPSLQIKQSRFPQSLDLNLKIKSNISSSNNYLSGFIKADIKQNSVAKVPIEKAQMSLLFNGISANGFIDFSEAHAELDNLQQQAQWALEESGEFPEGQDQIWQLYDQIETSSQQLTGNLLNKMLSKQSLIQFKANSMSANKGKSEIIGLLKEKKGGKTVRNRGGVFSNSSNNMINTMLAALQGEANVRLDDELYPLIKKYFGVNEKVFKLKLKDNKWMPQ